MNNEINKEQPQQIRQMRNLIPVLCVWCPFMFLWLGALFTFFFVCLHVCAYASKFKVHCGSAFEATLLLHTTCVRSCCTWRASCVAA